MILRHPWPRQHISDITASLAESAMKSKRCAKTTSAAVCRHAHRHVYRHVHEHVYRHVCGHGYGHVRGHAYICISVCVVTQHATRNTDGTGCKALTCDILLWCKALACDIWCTPCDILLWCELCAYSKHNVACRCLTASTMSHVDALQQVSCDMPGSKSQVTCQCSMPPQATATDAHV